MDAVHEITRAKIGMTAVVHADGRVAGIFTEGDLRRLLESVGDVRALAVAEVMTRTPTTIAPDALAAEAAELLNRKLKSGLLVVQGEHLVGALHFHDLMAAKII